MDLSYANAGALKLLIVSVTGADLMINRVLWALVKVSARKQLREFPSHGAFTSVQTIA